MSGRIALQLNAAVGIVTTILAAATISISLTRPVDVVTAVAARNYGLIAAAIGQQVAAWFHVLLRLL
jgi:hypothetical protein